MFREVLKIFRKMLKMFRKCLIMFRETQKKYFKLLKIFPPLYPV